MHEGGTMDRAPQWTRRRVVCAGVAAGLATFAGRLSRAAASQRPLFPFGIASGYPTSFSVVLWTRLALDPLAPGGALPYQPLEVRWQLAANEAFRDVVASGTDWALPQHSHTVHIEPGCL